MNSDSWQDRLAALRSSMPEAEPEPEAEAPAPSSQKTTKCAPLEIVFERKGRAGKCATIVAGFTIADSEVAALAADIKKALGTGGSARGGEILIQGDRRDDVRRVLLAKGFRVK